MLGENWLRVLDAARIHLQSARFWLGRHRVGRGLDRQANHDVHQRFALDAGGRRFSGNLSAQLWVLEIHSAARRGEGVIMERVLEVPADLQDQSQ